MNIIRAFNGRKVKAFLATVRSVDKYRYVMEVYSIQYGIINGIAISSVYTNASDYTGSGVHTMPEEGSKVIILQLTDGSHVTLGFTEIVQASSFRGNRPVLNKGTTEISTASGNFIRVMRNGCIAVSASPSCNMLFNSIKGSVQWTARESELVTIAETKVSKVIDNDMTYTRTKVRAEKGGVTVVDVKAGACDTASDVVNAVLSGDCSVTLDTLHVNGNLDLVGDAVIVAPTSVAITAPTTTVTGTLVVAGPLALSGAMTVAPASDGSGGEITVGTEGVATPVMKSSLGDALLVFLAQLDIAGAAITLATPTSAGGIATLTAATQALRGLIEADTFVASKLKSE